ATYDWLPDTLLYRLVRSYGTAISTIIGAARSLRDLGTEIAPNLYEAELYYLRAKEWVCCAEDVLWRRTKLGLGMQPDQVKAIEQWFAAQARLGQAAQ
ncbi:MAG TPA: glycerol-3-phosphate dehydrogenase, partial [Thalassospira sp.]|nr:glycerol-3-phosphate dehydrogenase [Thalassospira sp.]